MQMSDRIVEQVHAVRRKISEECDFDLEKLGEYYMRLQEEDPANLVAEVPATGPEPMAKAEP
jgi:hypothetical protein